ncbi:regulatory protein SusR [Jejuia pallidilutea]|uniref:Regulatory protein SusR n=1 Tax=Jejuia pallidilutea TaxID=504487 RepID=A0A090W536_9FLAO|nr:regulatory protein SusR [Jejuia pallidilutea]GAL72135.1 regulatory protein SusR [Jejuia pallidilutea]
MLVVLEETMAKRNEYDLSKEERINNLKKLLEDPKASLENHYYIINRLIDEYEYYSFDATLHFIEKNLELANELDNNLFKQESTLRLAKLLATSGRYDESIKLLEEINSTNLSQELKREYYIVYKRCYYELRTISRVNSISEKYNQLYFAYKDSLDAQISKLNENSKLYLEVAEQNYRDVQNTRKAFEINTKRLALAKMGTREYAMVAFNRSYMSHEIEGNRLNQKKFLILSAMSDIQSSVKDNASMTNLAVILFEEGDVDRAHKYIDFSFEDAKFYNSKLRFLDISNVLPVISKSFEIENNKQSNKLKRQLMFISFLSIILTIALFFIYRQYKKIKLGREYLKTANLQLKELNDKLSYTNKDLKRLYEELSLVDSIKEQYIGTFLNLYSEYIDKLDVYRKTIRKYIVTNKTNDLLELIKSKNVVDEELKIFYANFDKSFLHIYPNFIESFNELLKEDGKIIVKQKNTLTVELRIFALIRLGISNSSKIAKILRYSVNTIYNYRVKVRNSAINRDEFEDMVKKIM